jgi:hypothetical protein
MESSCQTKTAAKKLKNEAKETTPYSSCDMKGLSLYSGAYFEINYPSNFTPDPNAITKYNGNKFVTTDEATFTSPDKAVEFFVFSPLWAGNPKNYLIISSSEEVVSEKTKRLCERFGQYGDRIIRQVTIRDKNSNYYRSYLSIKEQVGTESELHHVFGIKYKSHLAYEKYHDAYLAFKKSLKQFSD